MYDKISREGEEKTTKKKKKDNVFYISFFLHLIWYNTRCGIKF